MDGLGLFLIPSPDDRNTFAGPFFAGERYLAHVNGCIATGCDSFADDNEYNPAQCNDNIDNDGDGKTDGADPMCASGGDSNESPANYGDTLECGNVDLSYFKTRYSSFFPEDDAPAYVNTPRDEADRDIRSPDMLYAAEHPDEAANFSIPWAYENHNYGDGKETGDDSAVNSADYGFAEPLPSDTTVDIDLEVAMKWVDADRGAGQTDGDTDPDEYGISETYVAFYDANGQVVDSAVHKEAGGSTYLDSKVSNLDHVISDYIGDTEGKYVETVYPTMHFDNVGGAVRMIVENTVTSVDEVEDHGEVDHSDDYDGDPDVWAGLIGMQVGGSACTGENHDPISRDDGTTGNPILVAPGESTNIGVLENDGSPPGSGHDQDGDSISISSTYTDSSQSSATSGTNITYNPGSLAAGASDLIHYSISDGNGGTDSASVYIKLKDKAEIGHVTANLGGGVSSAVANQTTVQAHYDSEVLGEPISLSKAAKSGWTVGLATTSKVFKIKRDEITPPDGYGIPQFKWIQKNPSYNDFTGQPNSAELGRSYDISTPTPLGAAFTVEMTEDTRTIPDPSLDRDPDTTRRYNFGALASGTYDDESDLSYHWEVISPTNGIGNWSLDNESLFSDADGKSITPRFSNNTEDTTIIYTVQLTITNTATSEVATTSQEIEVPCYNDLCSNTAP